MAFTSSDLASIEAAIVALATGERAVRVTLNAKTTEYAEADLDKLLKLRAVIAAAIGTTIPRAYARNLKRATL